MATFLIAKFIVLCFACATQALLFGPPQLDPDEWWGPAELQGCTNTTIRPFRVTFSQKMIQDLKNRLRNHVELIPPLEGVAFEYGFNTDQVQPWVKYWLEEYNFQERENFFNQFPQYKTNIQGLDIHMIWIKPKVPRGIKTVPLLLLNGWPNSIRGFYDTIPILTTPAAGYDFVFEVIVPSLPGFGFSDRAARPGLGPAQIAVIFKNLMNRLGHKKFYIQGGDWGSITGRAMATMFQKDVLGFHSNMLTGLLYNNCAETQSLLGGVMASMQLDRDATQRNALTDLVEESGYLHIQATKPDTIGIALTDSPVGLLAYIMEKFSTGVRAQNRFLHDGGLRDSFSREQLVDNVMVYWSTKSIVSTMRLYAEGLSNAQRALRMDQYPTSVPTWSLIPKHDFFNKPPNLLKFPNLLGQTEVDAGHFTAFESPEPFSDDVFKAVKAFMEFHKTKTEL